MACDLLFAAGMKRLAFVLLALPLFACATPSVTDLGGAVPASTDDPGAPEDPVPTPPMMQSCSTTNEVVFWSLRYWDHLDAKLKAHMDPCTQYYISIPPVECLPQEKICPRGPVAPKEIRALGPNFHAMAEFHWGSWRKWVEEHPGKTWTDAGREFRKKMGDAGYDVPAGDTWAINEFPSTVRLGKLGARLHARQAVAGLFNGFAGYSKRKGAVFIMGMGQSLTNMSVYKPSLERWLSDAPFWVDMNKSVRWWGQEVYPDPRRECVAGSTIATRSSHMNEFVEHVARLAVAGGTRTATARSYLGRAFTPLLNATWNNAAIYHTDITVPQMEKYVSLQVYAVRAWSRTHEYPDNRIGFGWEPFNGDIPIPEFTPKLDLIADRLAASVHDAYRPGGTAARACSPTGSLGGCACEEAGASFNGAWADYSTF
jgi:hypothetical protein